MPDLLNSPPKVAARPAPARAPRTPAPRPVERRSRVLTGINSAVAAVAAGLLIVESVTLLVWIAEPRSAAPLSAALRTGAAFWLLGHGGHLHLSGGTAALIPLGLTLLFAALTARAGAAVARVRPVGPRPRMLLGCALAVGIPYALIATLVAILASGGGLGTSVVTTLLGSFVLTAGAAAVGAARELPLADPRRGGRVAAVAAGVGVAGAVLIAVSALVAGVALLAHLSDAAALARPAKAGAVGGLGMLALQAALAPNVVVWSSAYLLGPGFAVGAGTLVSPTGVRLGDVPALPVLAGLPSSPVSWPLYVLFLAPIAAGLLAAVVMVRRLPRTPRPGPAALLGAGVGVAVGVIAALLAALSGGSVTRGRLTTIGPSPWQTGFAAALEIGVPCLLCALVLSWRHHRRRHPATTSAAAVAAQRPLPKRLLGLGYGMGGRVVSGGWNAGRRVLRPVSRVRVRLPRSRLLGRSPAVDLQKTQPILVDLTKPEAQAPRAKAPKAKPPQGKKRLLRAPRPRLSGLTKRISKLLPKRLKRRSKVVKLPD